MQKTSNKHQDISVSELLNLIPDQELVRLAAETNVDHYSKVLYGKSMFYMLLMGLLCSERASLRVLEDMFKRKSFKAMFNLDPSKTVKYNSISERLAVMEVAFFEKAFELFYAQLSGLYSQDEMLSQKIVRVDSTMVAETSAKLLEGMCVGCKKDGKKQTKYTIAFDGIFPCGVEVFSQKNDLSEDRTIPNVVFSCAERHKGKIFVFDRGVQKRETFDRLSMEEIEFVCRLKEDSRREVVRTLEVGNGRRIGSLFLVSDEEVRLFGTRNKKPTEKTFRLITTVNDKGEHYLFLSNIFDLLPEVILLFYRKRWDIEVFYRFLKQELNLSHFFSTKVNGIKIIIYMTLILSMLILIYKRKNNLGFKTAKRRFMYELDWLLTKIIVHFCGGEDPDIVLCRGRPNMAQKF
jgi:transposase